jgi:hypothetical protein
MVLNNTPVDSLGGQAPITAMTGREPMGQLDPLVWRLDAEPISLKEVWKLQDQGVWDLQETLEGLHRPMQRQSPSIDAGGGKNSLCCPILKWGILC